MAFGSWLKKAWSKVKDVAKKVLPIARKVVGAAIPMVQTIGSAIGGSVGSGISEWGTKIGSGIQRGLDFGDRIVNGTKSRESVGRAQRVGAGGAGIRRIIPELD